MEWLSTSSLVENPNLFDWHRQLSGREGPIRHFDAALPHTSIGNDVWIGYGAFIRSGVTVGDGAVIGGMANVIHDVPPYAIVVGNPARVVRYRFSEDIIELLLKTKWWRFSIADLSGFDLTNPKHACEQIIMAEAEDLLHPFNPGMVRADHLAR
ncbi:CatB-related O-acetyltransferase [Pseudohoeflea suaedae]|nr:CatB-related O-acetyltransferase [Pseudohoeflea suaedae]